MSIHITVDLHGLNNINARIKSGQRLATNQAMLEMHDYVPKRRGHLRDDSYIDSSGSSIIYTQPYARPQFRGMINGSRVHNYTTAGTGRRWDLRLKGNKSKMQNVDKAFVNGAKLNGLNK